MRVMTVLKTGGDFTIHDVNTFFDSIYDDLAKTGTDFYCITDSMLTHLLRKDINIIPVRLNSLVGWWAKMELFSVTQVGSESILYFDLDTVCVDTIEPIIDACEDCEADMVMLNDFYYPHLPASGVMYITHKAQHVIGNAFFASPFEAMQTYKGDQEFIAHWFGKCHLMSWSDLVGRSMICSYKAHIKPELMPANAKPFDVDLSEVHVVCFHGNPRPKDVDLNTEIMNKLR